MRNWKDNGRLPLKHQKVYAFAIAGSYLLSLLHYLAYGSLSYENIAGIILATFLIYCIWFGGMYKIIMWWTERKLRQSEHDWKPDWKK